MLVLAAGCHGETAKGHGHSHGEGDLDETPLPPLVINEVRCDGEDFVEVVNLGDAPVELDTLWVTDAPERADHRADFDQDTVEPGGFALARLQDFGLRCADETAVLMDEGARRIDTMQPPAPTGLQQSWGRLPDGTGAPTVTAPTPGAPNQPAPATAALFDNAVIHEIAVELSPESRAAIDAEAVTPIICVPHERNTYAGTVTIDGVRLEHVGVRARGNATAETLAGKPSLRLDFAWDDPAVEGCAEPRTVAGQKRLNLLNMRQDPSFVRIPLAGELYRALDVPQPRTSWARLTIDGEYTGIVVVAETIDRQFLSQWFDSNDGMMYESGCHCDVVPGSIPPDGVTSPPPDAGVDHACFGQEFAPPDACSEPATDRDPTDWALLHDFVDRVQALPTGGFYPEIETFFDFDGFLSLWAATMFLGSGDGYFMNQNSYRIYHDPSDGRFALVDHGSADGILRTFADTCDADLVLQLGPAPDVFASTSLLPQRCMAEPACKAAFAERLWQVHDRFADLGLRERAVALHDFIIDEMRDDPRYHYNGCGVDYSWPQIEAHFDDYVLPWIDRRFDEVASQLQAAGYGR